MEEEDDDFIDDPSGVIDPLENNPEWFKSNQDKIPCLKFSWDGVYDLNPLKNLSEDWSVKRRDADYDIFFNFCHYTDNTYCEDHIPDNFAQFRTKVNSDNPLATRSCGPLTSNLPTQEMVEGISRPNPENTREDQYGVRISRASGIECPFNSDDFDLN